MNAMLPHQFGMLNLSRIVRVAFLTASILQGLHIVEHIAQIYEHAFLGWSIQDSHGIIFFLDLEWNHFIFDSIVYLSLLAYVFFKSKMYLAQSSSIPILLFTSGLAFQSYHAVEHFVRMMQYYQSGCTPCLGILGNYVDLVYLHGFLNFAVYGLTLIGAYRIGLLQVDDLGFRHLLKRLS